MRKTLWSVNGDINGLSQVIRRWLDKTGRIASPKFLLGESYGGFRAPRLARRLAEEDGVGLKGLVMVSPVLDFGNHSGALDYLGYAVTLPSMNAAVRVAQGQPAGRADLADAEAYASGAFLTDVVHGVSDTAALGRVVDKVSALTGLDPNLVRRQRGLVSTRLFVHEHDRATGRIDSLYDTTVTLPDPFPEFTDERNADPMLDGLRAPLTASMLAVYDMLHWHPSGPGISPGERPGGAAMGFRPRLEPAGIVQRAATGLGAGPGFARDLSRMGCMTWSAPISARSFCSTRFPRPPAGTGFSC